MTSAAYSTGPTSRALFKAAVLIFCCCFLHQALAIDKSIDDLDEEYDCIWQMDLNEDVFPAKVQDGIVTFMPTNRSKNLNFTALSTSRAEQHFSILVEEYDPDIVPRLGNETATLDDDKKTIVWSCKRVIEQAVQTKCQFLDQEEIKCKNVIVNDPEVEDSGMLCNTTFGITCATNQSSRVTGIERAVFFFTSDISTSVNYENFPCKFEVKAIEEEFHLLTKKGDPISKNAKVQTVTQCLNISNMVSNASSTAGPASTLSNSTTSQPESEFDFMVCITQWHYLLSALLVTLLLLLILFVVLLIVCLCCRKKDKPKQPQHKDQGKQSKIETKQSKTSTGKSVNPIRKPKNSMNEPPRIDEIDEMQQDFQAVDVPDTVDIDEQDCKALEVPVEQECEGVDVPDTVEEEDYDHDHKAVEVPASIEEEDCNTIEMSGKKRRTFIKAKEAKKRDTKHKDLHLQLLQPSMVRMPPSDYDSEKHVGPLPLKDEDYYSTETDEAENKPKKKQKTTSIGKKGADDKPAEMKSEKRKKTTSLGKKGADDKPAEMKSEQKPTEDTITMKEEESSGFKVMPMPTDAITDTQTAYDEPKEVLPESDDKPEKEEDGVTQESDSDEDDDDDNDDD